MHEIKKILGRGWGGGDAPLNPPLIHSQDTIDVTTGCILKLDLQLETRSLTEPNKLHA